MSVSWILFWDTARYRWTITNLPTHLYLASTLRLTVTLVEFHQHLSCGKKAQAIMCSVDCLTIDSVVLTQYQCVTDADERTDRRTVSRCACAVLPRNKNRRSLLGHPVLLWPPYVIGEPLYFCPVVSFLPSFYLLSFFSSPNLSGRRSDVCHTSTHGVALVRI